MYRLVINIEHCLNSRTVFEEGRKTLPQIFKINRYSTLTGTYKPYPPELQCIAGPSPCKQQQQQNL